MSDGIDLSGKNAIVTGAGSGMAAADLGRASLIRTSAINGKRSV